MRNIYSFLLMPRSTAFIISLSVLVVVILSIVTFLLWWTEYKQKKIKDLGRSIAGLFKRLGGFVSDNKPVKTVYSDKSRNFSGTEFLPVPAKAPTTEFTYEFVGWDKNNVDEEGNTVAKPIYIQKVNLFKINVFDDDKQTLVKSFEVEYGAGVDLSDIKLSKPESKEFLYEFVGFDKDTTKFYSSENVYAVYKAIPKKFTYTFFDRDGKSVLSQTTAIYGTPILSPEPPQPQDLSEEFAYWRGYEENMLLTHDESFVAVFRKTNLSKEELKSAKVETEPVEPPIIVDKAEVEEPKQAEKVKPLPSDDKDIEIVSVAAQPKRRQAAPNETVTFNDEIHKNKKAETKPKVQKLEVKSDEETAENISTNVTYIGHRKKD